jgi:hypothetical protein
VPLLAIGAVDLVAFAVALVALLALLAMWVFMKPIEAVLKHVPFIGSSIAGAVTGWLEDAMRTVAGSFDGLVRATGHFLWAIGVGLWNVMAAVHGAIIDVKFWAITAYHAATAAAATATTLFDQAERDIAQALSNAEAAAVGEVSQAVAPLQSAISGLEADIATVESDVVSAGAAAIAGAVAAAEGILNPAIQALEGDIAAAADAVLSEANTLFGQAEAAIAGVAAEVVALPGVIEGVIPGVVDQVVPGLIAGAIPGILAQVLPRVAALEAEAAECLEPLCDTVTPNARSLGNLGKFLQDLETLGFAALIVALAAESITHPQAVADDISSVVSDIGGGPLRAFRDVIGV